MLIDARRLPDDTEIRCNICVIGGGPAGITLARRWIDKPLSVAVLESGGLGITRRAQSLARGRNVGLPGIPLHVSRIRCLGGATARWTGWCRPLDPIDFEVRGWIPHSGWPFGPEELAAPYREAHHLCELGTFCYDADPWARAIGPEMPVATGRLRTRIFHHSPPTRFGVTYREQLAQSSNVAVYLNATVLSLKPGEGDRVAVAEAVAGSGRLTVRSDIYVLAAGGIENARVLLLSGSGRGGLGNRQGLVGRYFMEHPILLGGTFEPHPPWRDVNLYTFPPTTVDTGELEGRVVGAISPSTQALRDERINNCALYLMRRRSDKTVPDYFTAGVASLHELAASAKRLEAPERSLHHLRNVLLDPLPIVRTVARACRRRARTREGAYVLRAYLEPQPNPSSRVELSVQRDRYGQPRAQVRWQLTESDRLTLRRLLEIVDGELRRTGSGRIRPMGEDTDCGWPPTLSGGSHHMGTTRMHPDPARGVVDAVGQVHGVSNLYVAGSSVFPTAGYANPTLTIIALAVRLADHLEGRFRKVPVVSQAS